jgi:hypothetical protein
MDRNSVVALERCSSQQQGCENWGRAGQHTHSICHIGMAGQAPEYYANDTFYLISSASADLLLTQELGHEVAAPWREGIVKRQPS